MNKLHYLFLFTITPFLSYAQIQMEIDGLKSKIGIGTETPLFTLDVQHRTGIPSANTHNGLNIKNTASNGHNWTFYVNNGTGTLQLYKGLTKVGEFNPTDGEYKDIQAPLTTAETQRLTNQLSIINRLNPQKTKSNSRNQVPNRYGFIAKEVQQLIPTIVRETSEEGEESALSISYKGFIPVIIAAMQEQQLIIEQQQAREGSLGEQLTQQQVQINALQKILSQLLAQSKSPAESTSTIILKDQIKLEQNHPNPFSKNTTISYFLPQTVKKAQLKISNSNGQLLTIYPIQQTGQGKITIDNQSFTNGTYFYSIQADGQIIATKRMIIN